MTDLYLGHLEKITIADVEAFLALDRPEGERPRESVRLDFKQLLPQDVGRDVAAMANSYGGLILIGVTSNKAKQNIPTGIPGAKLGPDAKARITDAILATVHPRPDFEVGAIPRAVDGQHLGIIRIREGISPPYEFEQGATISIPIRVQDTNRQATLWEVEALLKKRESTTRPASAVIPSLVEDPTLYCTYDAVQGEIHERNFHKVFVVPRSPLRVRLDIQLERAFEALVRKTFPSDHGFTRLLRRGNFHQVEFRVSQGERTHRIWRVWHDGTIGFMGNLMRPRPRGERLGDIAADLLFSCRLARAFFEWRAYWGEVVVVHVLSCPDAQLVAEFPPPGGVGDYDKVRGIHFPSPRPEGLSTRSVYSEDIDQAMLDAPEELISEIILSQVRDTWGASVNFADLLEAVERLSTYTKAPGWGRVL